MLILPITSMIFVCDMCLVLIHVESMLSHPDSIFNSKEDGSRSHPCMIKPESILLTPNHD